MRNIKCTLEYDGTRYNGWQRLGKEESTNTIEMKIKEVLKKMTGEEPDIFCASRTETGVHAYGQVIHFKTTSPMSCLEIKQYMNRYLPMDIAILTVEEKTERFHCSLNAKWRTYQYRISIGEVPSVFDRKYTYYCFKKPDCNKMKLAAEAMTGKHDFKNFSTVKKAKSTVKTVQRIDIYQDASEIQITITANDFLHNMARMMAATLLDVGLGKLDIKAIPALLDSTNKEKASAPLPAQGLFLSEIIYEDLK